MDCNTCRYTYEEPLCLHPAGDWFSIHDVALHYCKVQIAWMVKWSDLLDFGKWPPDYTGYDKAAQLVKVKRRAGKAKKRKPTCASHQATMDVWQEIIKRMETTGEDGGEFWKEAHKVDNFNEFPKASMHVLNYLSGYRRKRLSYPNWLKQRKWREEQR